MAAVDTQKFKEIENRLNEYNRTRLTEEDKYQEKVLKNLEEYTDERIRQINKDLAAREVADKKYFDLALKRGLDLSTKLRLDEKKAKLKEEKEELKRAKAANDKAAIEKAEAAKKAAEDDIKAYKEQLSIKERIAITQANREAATIARQKNVETLKDKNASLADKLTALKGAAQNPAQAIHNALTTMTSALAGFAASLKQQVNEIAGYKTAIDTRLQGSRLSTKKGSYWDQISSDITGIAGISPLIKQADLAAKIKEYVGEGISFNVEQRAFLQVISEKIATTFDANDATLRRLIRIQQEDTTAARLGMESALTAFLNNMYETTEYMTQQAATIRQSLGEASALMTAKSATEFEYQVQKWMGSLYSVGFNNTGSLAETLGKLAAGDLSALSGEGAGNLLVMAANKANLSIADILADGLDSSDTNTLMQAMVDYLAGLYSETKNSNVVSQQLAKVYGLTASDLKAAASLATSSSSIYGTSLSYGGMLGRLNSMANSMYKRTSQAELMENALANVKYTLSAGIANNSVLYHLFNLGSILKDATGGIDFGIPLYMGTGTAQTFNIADMMLTGALSGSLISGLANIIGSGGNGGHTGAGLLKAANVMGNNIVSRGTGQTGIITGGATTSESGYVSNSSSSDITSSSMASAADTTNQQVSAKEEEDESVQLKDVNENVVKIYTLLDDVANGTRSLKVDMGDSSAWTAALSVIKSF